MQPILRPIVVDVIDRHSIFLQWGVEGLGSEPLDQWRVHIRTAYAESGPWTDVQRDLTLDLYTLRHDRIRRRRWQTPFYQLALTHRTRADLSYTSEPVYPRHPPDPKAVGIRTRLQRYLQSEYGVPITFLKRRTEGMPDPKAFDDLLHRPTGQPGQSHGHQFQGGFYGPIETYAKIVEPVRAAGPKGRVTQAPPQTQAWLAGTPMVSPGDLLVEWHLNRRWRVGGTVHRYARRQTLFRQVFPVEELPIADPEYDIDVPRLTVDTSTDRRHFYEGVAVVQEQPS